MSKRKNRSSSPNLPHEVLERARRQLAENQGETSPAAAAPEPETKRVDDAVTGAPPSPRQEVVVTGGAARIRARRAASGDKPKGKPRNDLNDLDYIRERLENPTRTVTEAELRQEYGYVLSDLRSMAVLAVALIVLLVVLAQVL